MLNLNKLRDFDPANVVKKQIKNKGPNTGVGQGHKLEVIEEENKNEVDRDRTENNKSKIQETKKS